MKTRNQLSVVLFLGGVDRGNESQEINKGCLVRLYVQPLQRSEANGGGTTLPLSAM